MDFTDCIDDAMDNFKVFLSKLDCNHSVKFLTLDGMTPGLSTCIEALGTALGNNKSLEVLNMRRTRIKIANYAGFWEKMMENKHLKKINVQKTDVNDTVVEHLT